MNNLTLVVAGLLILALLGAGIYGIFVLKRNIHYNWSYKAKVEQQICESVKHEHLKIKCD